MSAPCLCKPQLSMPVAKRADGLRAVQGLPGMPPLSTPHRPPGITFPGPGGQSLPAGGLPGEQAELPAGSAQLLLTFVPKPAQR